MKNLPDWIRDPEFTHELVTAHRRIVELKTAIAHALTLLANEKVNEAIEELKQAYGKKTR